MTIRKRGKGKVQRALTLADAYKDYHATSKGKGILDQPRSVYVSVNRMFNEMLSKQYLIEQGGIFQMPHNLGELFIRKTKIKVTKKKGLRVDWNTSKKVGKIVYFMNTHTNGYKYYLAWKKRGARTTNITRYKFVLSRANKRYLAHLLKSPNSSVDYISSS